MPVSPHMGPTDLHMIYMPQHTFITLKKSRFRRSSPLPDRLLINIVSVHKHLTCQDMAEKAEKLKYSAKTTISNSFTIKKR